MPFGTAIALIYARQVWNHRWNTHLHEIQDIFNNHYKGGHLNDNEFT